MDPYFYHQHPILELQYYGYAVPAHYTIMPIFYPQPVQYVDMWVNQEQHPMHSYFQNQNYVPYQTPDETSFLNTYDSLTLDETLFMQEIEEEISEHLYVYTAQRKMSEVDACCICLGDYEKKEKIGRLECGHRFHAECIKRWLLSKNVCPSTALTV
ncbi:putative transcription factor C2H2 family [Helianthus debilis subsp. tardiflorus]